MPLPVPPAKKVRFRRSAARLPVRLAGRAAAGYAGAMRIKPFKAFVAALLCGALLGGGAGCLSTKIKAGETAYVYVAPHGVVTFQGDVVQVDELPARLRRAGADGRTPVKLVAQGEVPQRLMEMITGVLGRNGLRRVLIMGGPRHAAAVVDGQTITLPAEDGER